MAFEDGIVRAQARALLRVLEDHLLLSDMYPPPLIWQELVAFGDEGTTADLPLIGRRHAGTAAAAFCGGIRNQAPQAALLLALTCFTKVSPPYRLRDPSRWLALMIAFVDGRKKADPAVQAQLLNTLQAVFEAETAAQSACSIRSHR
jgi:hypothetical protein